MTATEPSDESGGDGVGGTETAVATVGRSAGVRAAVVGRRRLAAARNLAVQAGRVVLGNRHGAALFCGVLIVYGLCWRLGFLINDNYTIANAFLAVSKGQLAVEQAVYGPGLETPGMFRLDGAVYGRNYGQLVLSLPFLWAVEAAAAAAALRVALASAWGLIVVGFTLLVAEPVGRQLGRPCGVDGPTAVTYAGCGLALGGVGLAVRGTTPIAPRWHGLIALQLATMVAAGLVGVLVYRLLTRIHGWRVGLAAGIATALSAPIGFWAAVPKRHVPITLCVLVAVYALYRSRAAEGTATVRAGGRSVRLRRATAFRALAYVPVGVVAWINALEGILLLGSVVIADLPTADRDIRSITAAGIALGVSLLPMFLTNYLISGSPLQPPNALLQGGVERTPSSDANGGSGDTSGSNVDGNTDADVPGLREEFDTIVEILSRTADYLSRGVTTLVREPGQTYIVLVRSHYTYDVAQVGGTEVIRLSVLESLPLAGALVALPLFPIAAAWTARGRLWPACSRSRPRLSPARTVDLFALTYVLLLLAASLHRLGGGGQVTTRYVLPIFPLLVYGVARLPAARRVVRERTGLCALSYAAGVGVGGQLLLLTLWTTNASLGEASQLHAAVNAGAAVPVAGWALADVAGLRTGWGDRVGAVALGLAAAAGTVFFLLARLWHFTLGGLVLPFV